MPVSFKLAYMFYKGDNSIRILNVLAGFTGVKISNGLPKLITSLYNASLLNDSDLTISRR